MNGRTSTVEDPRAVSVGILKGGVGKSTIAINLAERLGSRGHSVLLIDVDPDGHGSFALGYDEEYTDPVHLGSVIFDEGATFGDIIHDTGHGFDILPSNQQLMTVESRIEGSINSFTKLRDEVVQPLLGNAYDYIIFDTSPEQGKLADTAPVAAGNVIIPINATEEVITGFEKMYATQISEIQKAMDLNVLAIIPNDYASRNNIEKELVYDLEKDFPEALPNFASSDLIDDENSPGPGLRHRIAFSRATKEDMPLAQYDPENDQLERLDELADIVERGSVADE